MWVFATFLQLFNIIFRDRGNIFGFRRIGFLEHVRDRCFKDEHKNWNNYEIFLLLAGKNKNIKDF